MDFARGSTVSTCFMYGGKEESAKVAQKHDDEVARYQFESRAMEQLEAKLAEEEVEEVEWEADIRYLLLELWEVLNDDEHSDAIHASTWDYGKRISAQYRNLTTHFCQLYQRCKAALP